VSLNPALFSLDNYEFLIINNLMALFVTARSELRDAWLTAMLVDNCMCEIEIC